MTDPKNLASTHIPHDATMMTTFTTSMATTTKASEGLVLQLSREFDRVRLLDKSSGEQWEESLPKELQSSVNKRRKRKRKLDDYHGNIAGMDVDDSVTTRWIHLPTSQTPIRTIQYSNYRQVTIQCMNERNKHRSGSSPSLLVAIETLDDVACTVLLGCAGYWILCPSEHSPSQPTSMYHNSEGNVVHSSPIVVFCPQLLTTTSDPESLLNDAVRNLVWIESDDNGDDNNDDGIDKDAGRMPVLHAGPSVGIPLETTGLRSFMDEDPSVPPMDPWMRAACHSVIDMSVRIVDKPTHQNDQTGTPLFDWLALIRDVEQTLQRQSEDQKRLERERIDCAAFIARRHERAIRESSATK